MKIQFTLKTLVTLLVFASLFAGFLAITIRQQNELQELEGELTREREFSQHIASYHSAVVRLKAERQECLDEYFESHPTVKRIDSQIRQLEKEIPQLREWGYGANDPN